MVFGWVTAFVSRSWRWQSLWSRGILETWRRTDLAAAVAAWTAENAIGKTRWCCLKRQLAQCLAGKLENYRRRPVVVALLPPARPASQVIGFQNGRQCPARTPATVCPQGAAPHLLQPQQPQGTQPVAGRHGHTPVTLRRRLQPWMGLKKPTAEARARTAVG